jgi:hypothetical protein
MENIKVMPNCYTCWPSTDDTGKYIVKCVNSTDAEKVVRTYMHPTDDIQETLWLFEAKLKCFSNNNSISRICEEYKLLKSYSNNVTKYTDIKFISMK